MEINQSKLKAVQFLGSPFQGKEAERLKEQQHSKRLIALISTKGKTLQQSTREVMEAVQKYERVRKQVESKQKASSPQKEEWEVSVKLPQDVNEPPPSTKQVRFVQIIGYPRPPHPPKNNQPSQNNDKN